MNDSIEVRGVPNRRRRQVILSSRVATMFFVAMAVFYLVDTPDVPDRTGLVAMPLIIAAVFVVISEFFARDERRDSSSMFVTRSDIKMRKNHIHASRGRASRIEWDDVETIDVRTCPSNDAEVPGFAGSG
jgi:hypothetical protein